MWLFFNCLAYLMKIISLEIVPPIVKTWSDFNHILHKKSGAKYHDAMLMNRTNYFLWVFFSSRQIVFYEWFSQCKVCIFLCKTIRKRKVAIKMPLTAGPCSGSHINKTNSIFVWKKIQCQHFIYYCFGIPSGGRVSVILLCILYLSHRRGVEKW